MQHWEVDLIESWLKKGAFQVMTERKTRYTLITKMQNLSAHESCLLMLRRMKKIPQTMIRSFTYDNGAENACHQRVNRHLGTQSYFCHPYHGWEKGTVENTIGIIRRFYPKKTNLALIPDDEIQQLETWLNRRPRKILKFFTPEEVFKISVALSH